jgi:hypothetical protein
MKRYIEIIFDDSISMQSSIGNSKKYEIAKRIFKDSVLPFINFNTDNVALRLLRGGCEGRSHPKRIDHLHDLILAIENILHFDNTTPLFLTIKDAINTCHKVSASYGQMHLFVLTDGEDNCSSRMEDVFSQSELDSIGINLDVLIVQFGVEDDVQANNLSAFSNYIGATTVQVKHDQLRNYNLIKDQLRRDLSKTSLNNDFRLAHCFDESMSQTITWDEVENQGYLRYWAGILYMEGFIEWDPANMNVLKENEVRELKFLCALRFKSDLPSELMKRMFIQLESPYYYCLDQIYWDFSDAKWKYFPEKPSLRIIENQSRFNEISLDNATNFESNRQDYFDSGYKEYSEAGFYRVMRQSGDYNSVYWLKETDHQKPKAVLSEGDIIVFRGKSTRGRPKKYT